MLRSIIILTLVSIVGFTSCKKTISKKACFNFSKNTAKVGDTVFLFNCSEGYQRCLWFLPNGATDTNRHSLFVATVTGVTQIGIRIGDYPFTDTTGIVKDITIEP